jgi:hypothetical protein
VVSDAAHTAAPILPAIGNRNVVAVVCTHGHNDDVTVARVGLGARRAGAATPRHDVLWRMTHPNKEFRAVFDQETLSVARTELR